MSKQYPISDEGDRIKVRDSLIAANHLSDDYDVGQTIIEGLLPVGLNLIVGLPKSGKSYLAMGYALSVCTGKTIGEIRPVRTGSCLFFSLETPLSICRNRFGQFLRTDELPPNLLLSGERGQRFSSWLVGLEDALSKYEDTVLVVIDSLALAARESLVRGYNKEYDILDGVRQLAYSRKLAIIVTHHSVKKPGHWVTSAYGSNALTAAADSIQVIDRNNHRLIIGGNGSSDSLFQLDWTDEFPWHPAFRLNSELSELKVTPEQFDLLKAIMAFGQNISPKDLETVFAQDRTPSALRKLFKQLTDKFLIVKVGFGKYAVTETGRSFLKQETKLAEIQTRLSGISREPDEALPGVAVEEPVEPSAENPVVVVDEPVIEPELEAGVPEEATSAAPMEVDPPEGSSPGDHEEGKEEAGPGGPLLPSEDTDAADAERESNGTEQGEPKDLLEGRLHEGYDKVSSTGPVTAVTGTPGLAAPVPHTQEGQASIEAPDREAFEAARDAIGFRTLKLDTEYGNDTREALKQEYKEKFIDCSVRGKSVFLAAESEPYSFESMVMDGELGKSLKRYFESQCLEALDLFVELAERGLLIHLKDWNRKFELRPVKEGHASIERPDGVATTLAERFSSAPPEILPRLENLEPVLCALMSEKGWEAVSNFIQGRYLSRWESGVLFDAFFNKRRPSTASLGTGLKKPERFHRLLIACQEPENSGLVCLRHDPSQFVFPLRRRQIRESLGLPTWPGDRTAR